jgi:hypothetical protein
MSGVTGASSMFELRHLPSNYAFKQTAGKVFRSNPPLRAGGGLTRHKPSASQLTRVP